MFKIGAFSKLVHVSARMLRHYKKYGLIYPVYFDKVSVNRFYSSSQIPIFGMDCEFCLACIDLCPKKAIISFTYNEKRTINQLVFWRLCPC